MTFIHISKPWQIPESKLTSEKAYFNRRRFIKSIIGASIGGSILTTTGCQKSSSQTALEATLDTPKLKPVRTNPTFTESELDRPLTNNLVAGQYNNFYEFGGNKRIWMNAQNLPTEDWQVKVTGLVKKPRNYDLDDIKKRFSLEERNYRFRCVEAWSMALPWIGFPMKAIIEDVEPTSKAKFVKFSSFYDPEITTGPTLHFGSLPWPYTESLSIEEMANELAFFAVGIYGKELPKQHGAPIRAVLPWKYGFKGAKSIVKIEFVETQPATFWHTTVPNEYDYIANVNPDKPHPRWSQASEKFIGESSEIAWVRKQTLPYNGYGEFVASLYS
ncbi:protein-methionine-sulfoxide reductase catalytic subunit MsrP [Oscillatoria salina]|uniref:protein-methionine-sulfoxide reductase catalytic subunit MsrP n=1 Tax=Oscillatoria salina TaxID=331517 RepID=UPI001CCFB077|nr:protein-methionine-sulfoxide reductase catalytic subunit MsrP [Oscillatoria salina]MBZ8181049.1 protein-methionine-sulfoxide reductase catalytic subunit MsrP [Oscillatoria salina IIICB1]